MRNISFLGCLNNRMQQMPKLAKSVALRLAEKAKEEKAKEASLQQERGKDNKNVRNKSTNIPSNQQVSRNPPSNHNVNNPPQSSNTAIMNRSGNGIRKPENAGMVKLPKVSTIGSSSVSNTSMKAIWDAGGVKKSGH
jgi:hypothetical protein